MSSGLIPVRPQRSKLLQVETHQIFRNHSHSTKMNIFSQFLHNSGRATAARSTYGCSSCSRRLHSRSIVKENDIVMLKHRTSSSAPIITEPLRLGKSVPAGYDTIKHDDIIGKALREVVTSRKRVLYRIHEPTLAEYTDNSPRLVTPIYSQDASLIVSLLDLHPTAAGIQSVDEEKLEIFEAGTGHGALTLNLARAIHAANLAAPRIPGPLSKTGSSNEEYKRLNLESQDGLAGDINEQEQEQKDIKSVYDSWRSQRRAVIHTLDVSEEHSRHAQKVVRNFRKGIYCPHVDFHVGSIEGYLSPRLAQEGRAFLDHAILDLPATHDYLEVVGQALKPNGSLLVFCPSVSQIMECVSLIKKKGLPLFMEKTVEVGGAIGVGGREWDIRTVKPRALLKAGEGGGEEEAPESALATTDNDDWKMICRPKVGLRVSGGGFVGQFRRTVEFSKPGVE